MDARSKDSLIWSILLTYLKNIIVQTFDPKQKGQVEHSL
jgi:hypothetical protein